MIVLDCREGEPDRSGAAASFEGFFDLETGEPRRPGMGHPRLRIVSPAVPAVPPMLDAGESAAPASTADAEPAASPTGLPTPSAAARPLPAPVERLWGFECWWRPDPTRAGLTHADHEELERSKALLRGLLRDTRRRGALQPR
ncbi:MAG: hypothetical protein NVS9B6_01940 [Candidatus Limnocylindrales bacterium]